MSDDSSSKDNYLSPKGKIGDKRFHSETSLQHLGENEDDASPGKDPGVSCSK